MQDEAIERKVMLTANGQQIAVEHGAGMSVSVYLPDDVVVEQFSLDVTADEFATIKEQAVTNEIPADILSTKKAD